MTSDTNMPNPAVSKYDNYPWWIVVVSILLSLSIYSIGTVVMRRLHPAAMAVFLLYVGWLEWRLMSGHCVDCFYYGKTCAFGRGRLSRLFFKQGDPGKFSAMHLTWKNMVPDMLVSLVPIAVGIALLFKGFDWALLLMIILLFLLTTAGNGFVRSQFACRHCRQRELGCPAEKLFGKKDVSKAG